MEPKRTSEVEAETERLESDRPVPCPWVKRMFWKEEEAEVEVAVMVPVRIFPMVEVERTAVWAKRLVEVAEVEVERLKVWPPVQVLAFPRFKEATTAPVVGEIVRVPSLLETDETAPWHAPLIA